MRRAFLTLLALWLALPGSGFADEKPSPGYVISAYSCGNPHCYWETPMAITDVEGVWAMLTQPITMVKGDAKTQVMLYERPSEASQPVGEITCSTQGLHVLETLPGGWTKVECYADCFHGSVVKVWNKLVTGYVPTDTLYTQLVKTTYGLVVDKLTQRLYVLKEGQLIGELAVSTGLPNPRQPYNETRSGEYLLTSRVGDFLSGDMVCAMAFRYNNYDLLHEVPYTPTQSGKKNYWAQERWLGQKASHGCIRVQRKLNADRQNMKWLWETLYDQVGTRLVIWEDAPGRVMPYPAEDTLLYYSPHKMERYHKAPQCYGMPKNNQPTESFAFSELDSAPYREMTQCPYCFPTLRKAEIDEINKAHQAAAAPD